MSPELQKVIRALLGTLAQQRVAEMFGVSGAAISSLKRGKTWAHVKSEVAK